MTEPLRVLWFGSYAKGPGYPRSETLIAGLRALSHQVEEVHEPLLDGASDRVGIAKGGGAVRLAFRQAAAAAGLARRWFRAGTHDVVVAGYGGLFDVHLLRLLQGFDRVITAWDAFIPLYDAVVRDRALAAPESLRARVLRRVERTAGGIADLVLADTEPHRDLLADDLAVPRSKIAVVPIAQPDPGEPAPLPPLGAGAGGGPLRVLLVASHLPLHGVDVVLEAARILGGDGVELTIVGTGQGIDAAVAAARGVRGVTIVPRFVPEAELAGIIRANHVGLGVFGTTPKALRVVPLKAALTMSHGRALVTLDGAAARAALDGAALLVPPGDAQALAGSLAALRDDPGLVRDLATAGRARYLERFTPQSAAAALVEAVRTCAASARRG